MKSSARISELLPNLLSLPKSDREAHLTAVCDDPELRSAVRELLQDRRRMREFLEQTDDKTKTLILLQSQFGDADEDDQTLVLSTPAARTPPATTVSTTAMRPDFIGPYHILKILGQGGMGVVYLAEQTEPVRRQLAVKLIHRSLRDPVSAARFEAERQAMARLSHPNIAQIFEAGTTEDGFPYFAMEYVPYGTPITRYCDIRRLTIEQRLQLFMKIARGVQHAHQRGILHRDLKPSNILVAEQQDEEIAKIIDFGLAKALDRPLTDEGQLTQGYIVGTPEYMSPEAFRVGEETLDLDTRSDVYSLGIILYEMLCSVRPFESKDRELMALVHELTTTDPPPLTRRLSSVIEKSQEIAERRGMQFAALRKRLSGDLDYVVRKAIALDREERYDSVADLIADIERHLNQEPVEAHPPSTAYRAKKFLRRHRVAATSTFLVVAAMILGTIGTTVGMLKANQEAEIARQALSESKELTEFLIDLFRSSDPGNPAQNLTAREILDVGAQRISGRFTDQPLTKAKILGSIGQIYEHLALYEQSEDLLSQSLDIYDDAVGRGHPETVQALLRFSLVRYKRDQFTEAEEIAVEALRIAKEIGDAPAIADATHMKALAVSAQTDPRSEELFREAVKLRKEAFGDNHLKVGHSLDGLIKNLLRDEKMEEVEALSRESLRIQESRLGADHLGLMDALRNLSEILIKTDRIEEAVELQERIVSIHEKAYGEQHPKLAEVLGEAAALNEMRGEIGLAETQYRRAASIYETVAPDAFGFSVTLNNFGVLYWNLKRYDEAEPLFARSLEVKEKLLEPGHNSLAHSANNLALIHWKRGKFEQAEEGFTRALTIWEEKFGPDHSLVAWPIWGLAGTYRDQGRYEEAEPLYLRALQIREKVLPPDSRHLRETREDYAVLLRATGRDDEAERISGSPL